MHIFSQAFTFAVCANKEQGEANVAEESGRGSEPRRSAVGAGEYLGHGLTWAVSTLVFLWLGSKADLWLGTEPWLALLGAFVGAGAGFSHMYFRLVAAPRDGEEGPG